MASLNDYNWQESRRPSRPRRRLWRFLWLQLALAAVLVIGAASLIGQDGWPGQAARYLVGQGLAAENSWLSFGQQQPETEPAPEQPIVAAGSSQQISFMAPASGVVVKGLALDAAGYRSGLGIVIQGSAGQPVKASAGGVVIYLGEDEQGFLLELDHGNGFASVYQGLSELNVGADQVVSGGETLGLTASGELYFSLYLNEEEVDPLSYLFQQEV